MLRNYLKTAWRNIVRTMGYSALNILGLATGMAVALLIGLWVHEQYSFDKFLPDYNQAYRVQRNFNSNGDTLTFRTTSLKLANALRTQIPEIEFVAQSDWMGFHGLMLGDKKMYIKGGQVGSDFLKIFRFPMLLGNADASLRDPYSIVLTESTAKSLFGRENPMYKTVRFNNSHEMKVTGILKDLPVNSSFDFNWLVPFSYLEATDNYTKENMDASFGNNSYQIFVKLRPRIDYARVAPKIRNIEHGEKDNTNAMNSFVTLQPLQRWHLYSNYINGKDEEGFGAYVRMFSIIGTLVLIIACINFTNLTTARSEKRAKEVGVRKAIGSMRRDLIFQFLMESLLLTFLAFILSLAIVQLALPMFNTLTGTSMRIPLFSGPFWLAMLGLVLMTCLIAGSRPAFYLSSFQPVQVLKSAMHAGKLASLPRKILVVLQFSCSIALIISTIIIYQQIQHARNRPNGYDLKRLLLTDMNSDLSKNYVALKNELIQKGIAENVTMATSPATDVGWHSDIDSWPGKFAGETVEMGTIFVADDYFPTVGMSLKEGRAFRNANDTASVVFNEAAIKRLRIKDPVNKMIKWGDSQFKIVGVVKDALMVSPFSSADPTMFYTSPSTKSQLMYRLSRHISTAKALAELNLIFNKYNPAYPYKYTFEDQDYAAKFKLEQLIGKLAGLFAGLAIFISCLGLFGLSAYIAEQRVKEIGIRKVLGASVSQLWVLLSREFVLLVLISCVLASPIAWYFLHGWLLQYDYRISIGVGVFVLAGLVSTMITLVTVSYQAIHAAVANPVKSLRTE